jgi:hypothetical protein
MQTEQTLQIIVALYRGNAKKGISEQKEKKQIILRGKTLV